MTAGGAKQQKVALLASVLPYLEHLVIDQCIDKQTQSNPLNTVQFRLKE